MILNPTGGEIRIDPAGDGRFRAPRGSRLHAGEDYLCVPGQGIIAPISGTFSRIGRVYTDDGRWTLVEIIGGAVKIKLYYVTGIISRVGKYVTAGDLIGEAQDITVKYPNQGMLPHVHMGVILLDDHHYEYRKELFINPCILRGEI